MKIGYAQFAPVLGDLTANLRAIERLAPAFAEADLVVLPELSSSGYRFASAEEARAAAEPLGESRYVDHLARVAREREVHLVAGLAERDGDDLYNTAVLVGPEGLAGSYRKIHLFSDEPDFFRPGDRPPRVLAVGSVRVGILICFDWVFPEVWRALALQGADVVCHPSNLVLPDFAQRAVPIHALVNGVYVVTANRVGTERDLTFTGASIIAGPRGEVLSRASPDEEQVAVVPMDSGRARDKWITPRNHLLEDRRPDLYDPGPA